MSRRNVSSASAAAISVSPPRGAASPNQCRKRETAAASSLWASREPWRSASVFTALRSAIGSVPTSAVPPAALRPAASLSGAVAPSNITLALAVPSSVIRAGRSAGSATSARASMASRTLFDSLRPSR